MLTAREYLSTLSQKGVKLWLDNGELRYHARKGCLTSADLAELRALKQDIIAQLSAQAGGTPDLLSAPRTPITSPLSFQQRWLWSLLERAGGWRGTLSCALRIRGSLNPAILNHCLRSLLEAHSSLRTEFVDDAGLPRQRIADVEARLLTLTIDNGAHTSVSQKIRELLATRLDPGAGPLVKAWCLTAGADEHYFVLVIHRLITDCPSFNRVLRDLWSLYGLQRRGELSPPSRKPSQYPEYALWQEQTDEDWNHRHAAYWSQRLSNAHPVHWPAHGNAPAVTGSAFGISRLSLGEEVSAGLRDLQRQTRTLLATMMLTVYVAAICKWCEQLDLVVPFNIAGRHSEHESTVGHFSHVLYLRLELSGQETFAELLKIVSKEFYGAVYHQDYGRTVAARPDLMGGTLFQWLSWPPDDFAAEGLDESAAESGLVMENLHFPEPGEQTAVPASVLQVETSFFDSPAGIAAAVIYRADRFNPAAMQQLLQHFRLTAERLARNPLAPALSG